MRTQKLKSSKKDFPGGSKPQRACASTAGDKGLIPGRGTMIPHALWYGQKRFFLIKIKQSICINEKPKNKISKIKIKFKEKNMHLQVSQFSQIVFTLKCAQLLQCKYNLGKLGLNAGALNGKALSAVQVQLPGMWYQAHVDRVASERSILNQVFQNDSAGFVDSISYLENQKSKALHSDESYENI